MGTLPLGDIVLCGKSGSGLVIGTDRMPTRFNLLSPLEISSVPSLDSFLADPFFIFLHFGIYSITLPLISISIS
jgi:hypothetical protein